MKPLCFIAIIFCCLVARWEFLIHARKPLAQDQILKPHIICGSVDSIPTQKFYGIRFQFVTDQHQKLLLYWYHPTHAVRVGERWQFTVRLKPPTGAHNPGGFDYERYLWAKGVVATGSIHNHAPQIFLGKDPSYFIARFREKIAHEIKIVSHEKNAEYAHFITALTVGIRNGLTDADWAILQKTGTNHLIAIAGLHIGFVTTISYFFIRRIWAFFPRALLWIPASRVAEIGALLCACFYSVLSGFALPAQRATLMLLCFLISKIACRQMSMIRRLWLSAVVVLLMDPFSLWDASFWLSFVSIAMLIWVMQGRLKTEKNLKIWAKMQLTIIVGLLPLMIWFFQQVSVISFFTNSVAIPWVGFLILPVIFLGAFLEILHLTVAAKKLFFIAVKLVMPLWWFLSHAAALPWASWRVGVPALWCVLVGMIGVFFMLAPRGFPLKKAGYCGLLPLFFYYPSAPAEKQLALTVLDVGQGLSVVVRTKHHILLYDTGAHIPNGFDVGEAIVSPYLRSQKIHTIDRLIISHGDNDHSGGADAVVRNFSVNYIETSAPKLIHHFHAMPCVAGENWEWDGVQFAMLYPEKNSLYVDNDSSCVIKMTAENTSVLLTGDIEKKSEAALVQHYGSALHSNILLSPHHGSKTSSSDIFLTAVAPNEVIISAGKYNRYHLPSKSVITRYDHHHLAIKNTAVLGCTHRT